MSEGEIRENMNNQNCRLKVKLLMEPVLEPGITDNQPNMHLEEIQPGSESTIEHLHEIRATL